MSHKPNPATAPNPQLGAAAALVQLLQDHPGLPRLDWEVMGHGESRLVGHAYHPAEPPFEILRLYAAALGGSIRPMPHGDYVYKDQPRQIHQLSTTWRDITIEVRVAADARAAVAA